MNSKKLFLFTLLGFLSSIDLTQGLQLLLSNNPDDIKFYFYPINGSPTHQQEIVYNNSGSLAASAFNPAAEKTVVLIHGFLDNSTVNSNAVLVPAYLNSGKPYNIIVVDWGYLSGNQLPSLSGGSSYALVVTQSVPIVSQRTTDFIKFLGVSSQSVHIVGHSLGAHIGGTVGANFKAAGNLIGRITGCDPAGPLYPLSIRPIDNVQLTFPKLNSDDASFVDIIHTNMGGDGDVTVDGDADFYPNGGILQPACLLSLDAECSHKYSYVLYAASLTKRILACKCERKNFLTGTISPQTGLQLRSCLSNCPSAQIPLGEDCPTSARGLYSLTTSDVPYTN